MMGKHLDTLIVLERISGCRNYLRRNYLITRHQRDLELNYVKKNNQQNCCRPDPYYKVLVA